jgi:hypothetical protein
VTSGVEAADLIEPWIYSTLSGDPQLTAAVDGRIYGALTPETPVGVYVTIALMSVRDVRGVGLNRVQVDAIYLVKAVAPTTTQDDVLPAARRITALLDGVDTDTSSGHISCVRETTISYPEVSGGQPFLHLGGTFRIRANT